MSKLLGLRVQSLLRASGCSRNHQQDQRGDRGHGELVARSYTFQRRRRQVRAFCWRHSSVGDAS